MMAMFMSTAKSYAMGMTITVTMSMVTVAIVWKITNNSSVKYID
jgi:hypothetical protein